MLIALAAFLDVSVGASPSTGLDVSKLLLEREDDNPRVKTHSFHRGNGVAPPAVRKC
jgi:hypothetical protein